ncbi:uncharacterized protein LOC103519645, partial [Diaphorina citri]|uniref:Uncharacterized protein LOC103519645 n=1 Tax=Diaphorina citri TaxID=121845 RepID=A0A1S4ENK9_DIACI
YRVDILWHSRNYFKWGLCIPSSCAPEDVLATLKKTLVPACAANNITMDLWINEDDCYTAPIEVSTIVRESNRCLKNWWTNFLYINNFVDPENMCLLQSWYLTADFQMFLFSIPVLYFIIQNPPWRVPVLGGVLAVSVALPSLIIYQNEIWALFPMITE